MAEFRDRPSGPLSPPLTFDDVQLGDAGELTRTFTQEDVLAFSRLVGDDNPLHLDEAFAATTAFGRCIVHGPLYTSLIGSVLATRCPGPGTILVRQEYRYISPLFVGDSVTARVVVIDLDHDSGSICLNVECRDGDQKKILDGRVTARIAR